jgi:uncharacterized protein (DUF3084 family)
MNNDIPSMEEALSKLKELNNLRETLIRRQAALTERHAQSERDRNQILSEMTQMGTSPETISADIEAARRNLAEDTRVYQETITNLQTQVETVEKVYRDLDTPPTT